MVPFQDSVTAVTLPVVPPKASPAVVVPFPAPANKLLAVFRSLTSVQLVPFQVSVLATLVGVCPPKAKAAVCVPPAAKAYLPVFKALTAVQLVPL